MFSIKKKPLVSLNYFHISIMFLNHCHKMAEFQMTLSKNDFQHNICNPIFLLYDHYAILRTF